jgi:hypothetical protein
MQGWGHAVADFTRLEGAVAKPDSRMLVGIKQRAERARRIAAASYPRTPPF